MKPTANSRTSDELPHTPYIVDDARNSFQAVSKNIWQASSTRPTITSPTASEGTDMASQQSHEPLLQEVKMDDGNLEKQQMQTPSRRFGRRKDCCRARVWQIITLILLAFLAGSWCLFIYYSDVITSRSNSHSEAAAAAPTETTLY